MTKNVLLPTSWLMQQFFQKHPLDINGSVINVENLLVLDSQSEMKLIPNTPGSYFIFSTIPVSELHTWSNYAVYEKKLIDGNDSYGCLYNGHIGKKGLKQRIIDHLYNRAVVRLLKSGHFGGSPPIKFGPGDT